VTNEDIILFGVNLKRKEKQVAVKVANCHQVQSNPFNLQSNGQFKPKKDLIKT